MDDRRGRASAVAAVLDDACDRDLRMIRWSSGTEDILRWSAEEVLDA